MPGMIDTIWILVAQYVALSCMVLAWIVYRVERGAKERARFRIERVQFYDTDRIVYYCSRRWMFNRWRTFEIDKGVKGYNTEEEAKAAMEGYLTKVGMDLTKTWIIETYG